MYIFCRCCQSLCKGFLFSESGARCIKKYQINYKRNFRDNLIKKRGLNIFSYNIHFLLCMAEMWMKYRFIEKKLCSGKLTTQYEEINQHFKHQIFLINCRLVSVAFRIPLLGKNNDRILTIYMEAKQIQRIGLLTN